MSTRLVDNLTIQYQEFGNGENTILLLHGWGQSHAFWKTFAQRLSANYHVYTVDLPGFGLSQEPHTMWSVKEYARFIRELIVVLHISDPIIIGHSFGGRIASVYVSRYPVKKLVLYSNGGLPQKGLHKKLYRHFFVRFGRHLFPNLLYQSQTTIFKPKQYHNNIILNKERSRRMLAIYAQPTPNLKEYFEKITAETLIISGKKDYLVEPQMGRKIHRLITNSHLVEIPDATHFAHLESPELFYNEVQKFLSKND